MLFDHEDDLRVTYLSVASRLMTECKDNAIALCYCSRTQPG